MEIYANGNRLDITLEQENTVGDFFKSFEQECAKNDATTVGIIVDGKNVTADDFDEVGRRDLSSVGRIEFSVISQSDIVSEFNVEAKECEVLSAQLAELSAKLQSGKDRESSDLISSLAAFLDRFCHTVTVSALFPEKFGSMMINGASIKEFFSDFSKILNDFKQAIEDKDTILMGDLAEYEISPRLSSISDAIKET